MESKVVKPLLEYENLCRKAKVCLSLTYLPPLLNPEMEKNLPLMQEELKSVKAIGEREVNKQRLLDRIRIRDPTNRKKIVSLKV